MQGQLTIFDFIKQSPAKWEIFRDDYCKKQGAIMKFDESGRRTGDENVKAVKACCFTPNHIKEPWDNWQPCKYENCPFVKEGEE